MFTDLDGYDEYGIADGILLRTGNANDDGFSEDYHFNEEIDDDLQGLTDYPMYGDLSSLEFTFTAPASGDFTFDYIFGSEEFYYSEEYNDCFGLFVKTNGGDFENIAKLPNGKNVSLNNLREACGVTTSGGIDQATEEALEWCEYNLTGVLEEYFLEGLFLGDYSMLLGRLSPEQQSQFLQYKDLIENFFNMDPEYKLLYTATGEEVEEGTAFDYFYYHGDGFGTTYMTTCGTYVNEGDEVTVKFAISDVSDGSVESFVIINAGSLKINPLKVDFEYAVNTFLHPYYLDDIDTLCDVMLTSEEIKAHGGESVVVWVDSKEILPDDVVATEKELIKKALPEGYSVNTYMDITVWKKFKSSAPEKIEILPNGKVRIGINVPEELVPYGDTIKVIRVHDGEAVILDGEFVPADGVQFDEYVFESDLYSTYALISTSSYTTSTGKSEKKPASPETGINNLGVLETVMIVSVLGFVTAMALKRKEER